MSSRIVKICCLGIPYFRFVNISDLPRIYVCIPDWQFRQDKFASIPRSCRTFSTSRRGFHPYTEAAMAFVGSERLRNKSALDPAAQEQNLAQDLNAPGSAKRVGTREAKTDRVWRVAFAWNFWDSTRPTPTMLTP